MIAAHDEDPAIRPPRSVVVDASRLPLLVLTLPVAPVEADFDRFMAAVNEQLERQRPFVNVIDCRHQRSVANAVQRKRMVEWIGNPRWIELSRFKLVDVLLLENALVRAAVAAVTWLVPPASPIEIAKSLADAERAIRRHCDAAGVELSPETWAYIRSH